MIARIIASSHRLDCYYVNCPQGFTVSPRLSPEFIKARSAYSGCRDFIVRLLVLLLMQGLFAVGVAHAGSELPRFIDAISPEEIFPGSDRLGSPTGDPLVAPAYQQGQQLGFVFLTSDFMNTTGYSGKPIHQLVAMDMQGVIRKVLLVEHHEPIVLIGIPEKRITAVLKDYEGLDVGELVRGTQEHNIDIVTGATVTVMVMDDTILLSAIKVARIYGLSGLRAERKPSGPVASVIQDIDEYRRLVGPGQRWLGTASENHSATNQPGFRGFSQSPGARISLKKARPMKLLSNSMRLSFPYPASVAACWVKTSTVTC